MPDILQFVVTGQFTQLDSLRAHFSTGAALRYQLYYSAFSVTEVPRHRKVTKIVDGTNCSYLPSTREWIKKLSGRTVRMTLGE